MSFKLWDSRQGVRDNILYGWIKPLICRVRGHVWWCAKIYPSDPTEYVWMCMRCVEMQDSLKSCGQCTNGCGY